MNANDRPVTVIVVDDHNVVRAGTRELLSHEASIEVVGEAATGEAAIVLARQLRPTVAVVDLQLPTMSGIDVIRVLAGLEPPVRSLVLSAYDDFVFVTAALAAGAAGYLLKTASAGEFVGAVRAVASGSTVLDNAILRLLNARWQQRDRTAKLDLTPREAEVLGLLARGRSNREIAFELGIGARTVEGHVSSILAKLGVRSRSEAVLNTISHHLTPAEVVVPGP